MEITTFRKKFIIIIIILKYDKQNSKKGLFFLTLRNCLKKAKACPGAGYGKKEKILVTIKNYKEFRT